MPTKATRSRAWLGKAAIRPSATNASRLATVRCLRERTGAGATRVGKSAVMAGSIEVEGSGLGALGLQARQRALHDGLGSDVQGHLEARVRQVAQVDHGVGRGFLYGPED